MKTKEMTGALWVKFLPFGSRKKYVEHAGIILFPVNPKEKNPLLRAGIADIQIG